MESHGMGGAHRDDKANAVIETLIQVVRVGGNLAITGTISNVPVPVTFSQPHTGACTDKL
jgi:hypothetical protein